MRSRSLTQRQAGFTLVEIAIVLVIIGLLLGGILKGQEMIVQAKIKNSISDFNGVLAAYNGYLDRYRALPGDDPQATRWTAITAVPGTAGNGVIQGAYETQTADTETRLFWQHLRLAGFIPGVGQQQPTNAHNGILGIQTGDAAGGATLAAAAAPPLAAVPGIGGVMICASQVPDKVAIAIDNQTDDGQSRSGQVRAVGTAGNAAIGVGQVPDANYQETGTTTYVVCRAM